MFRKKVFLEISQNSQGNTCARISILIKLQGACNVIEKETQVQVFSCEFCKISGNTFSYRTPPVAASVKAREASRKIWESHKIFVILQSVLYHNQYLCTNDCLFSFSMLMKGFYVHKNMKSRKQLVISKMALW